jgi:hypothetical protein
VPAGQISGPILTVDIAPLALDSSRLNVTYTR